MILPGSRWHKHLLLRSAWHYALQHPWQTWLSFLGIALGVMMVVAVDLANSSAARSFDLSVATINGSITHQISGGSAGVPDGMFMRLRTELGLRRSAPALSGTVRVQGQGMTMLGLDPVLTSSLADSIALYAGDHDLTDPYLSPLFGDFTGFPPTLLQAGTRDLFLSNAVRLHRAMRAAGVDAELHVFEAMPHGGFFGAPEDDELAREVARFVRAHLMKG